MSVTAQPYVNLALNIIGKVNFSIKDSYNETGVTALLRLLGFTNKVIDEPVQTFVSSFLKKKSKQTTLAKTLFKNYLEGLKGRVNKWKKDSNVNRINRINRLLGDGTEPTLTITEDDSLDVALQKISKFQKQVSEEQDQIGLLNTQMSFYKAATDKIDALATSMPANEFATLGAQVIALVRAESSYLSSQTTKFEQRVQALNVELGRLNQQEKLISTGIELDKPEYGTLSLIKVIDVFVYIVEKVDYKCTECFYFNNNLCTYGGNNLSTKPEQSCLEVYNKVDNAFWRPSQATLDAANKELT